MLIRMLTRCAQGAALELYLDYSRKAGQWVPNLTACRNGGITIDVGTAVPFNQAPLIVGTAISKNNNTTVVVNANGVY
jgi:hypothetical protein